MANINEKKHFGMADKNRFENKQIITILIMLTILGNFFKPRLIGVSPDGFSPLGSTEILEPK